MTDSWAFGDYTISTDKGRLDIVVIHGFLFEKAYWASDRTRELQEKAVENSLCFGVYHAGQQVGFARVITDYAVFAYLADVFVLEAHRGKSLGKRLIETVLTYPPLRTCGWTLFTKDAHGLYRQFGFTAPEEPQRLMRRRPVAVQGAD